MLNFLEKAADLFLLGDQIKPAGSSREGLISRKQWPLQAGDGSAPRGGVQGAGVVLQEADDKNPGLPGAHM